MTRPDDYSWLPAEIRDFIRQTEAAYPPDAVNFTVAEQREFYDRLCAAFDPPRPPGLTTEDQVIAGVPCRRYHPTAPQPGVTAIYYHGGGFMVGGLHSHDAICAELAEGAQVEMIAVDYRMVPEHIHPAAYDDACAVSDAVTGFKLLIGDSAGGNLAASVSATRADIGGQVLIYPGLGGDMTKGSYVSQSRAPGLTTTDVRYYRDIYKGLGSKYAEPLRETDYSGLPPAFLVAAGLDPLHDDCFDYAERLRAAGVPATVRDEPLLVHAFIRARHMSAPARASFDAIIEASASLAHSGQLPSRTT